MTIVHHEPIPVRHVETDYSPEQQADLSLAARALVALAGRIKSLTGDKFRELSDTGAVPVVELHTFEPTFGTQTDEVERPPEDIEAAQHIKDAAEHMRELIAKKGEKGMSVDKFQRATAKAGIILSDETTMQALIYGLDEGKFSIRDQDDRIVAAPPTSES